MAEEKLGVDLLFMGKILTYELWFHKFIWLLQAQ